MGRERRRGASDVALTLDKMAEFYSAQKLFDKAEPLVRRSLARHLAIDPDTIELDHELLADLGLARVDVVLVILRLEEVEGVDMPFADVEAAETVRDLVALVRAWSRDVVSGPHARARARGLRMFGTALVASIVAATTVSDASAGRDPTPPAAEREKRDDEGGVGVGVLYNLGFIPIRVDLAAPVTEKSGAPNFHVYISIGQSF